jgi:hypothetical protein
MVDRLQVFEDKLDDAINRIGKLETRMTTAEQMRDEIMIKLSSIESFVGGYNKIWGLAKKNWKTILTFGAGIITAGGFGNPAVQHVAKYVVSFLGVN